MVRELIDNGQYDELFSGGCCFHFALCSYRKHIGSLAYTRHSSDRSKKSHAFVITSDGFAFDRKGYRELRSIREEYFALCDDSVVEATEAEIVAETVDSARVLPVELEAKVCAIADEVITAKAAQKPATP
jgi:hypothetical protein